MHEVSFSEFPTHFSHFNSLGKQDLHKDMHVSEGDKEGPQVGEEDPTFAEKPIGVAWKSQASFINVSLC